LRFQINFKRRLLARAIDDAVVVETYHLQSIAPIFFGSPRNGSVSSKTAVELDSAHLGRVEQFSNGRVAARLSTRGTNSAIE
jgi:hypothetical protein